MLQKQIIAITAAALFLTAGCREQKTKSAKISNPAINTLSFNDSQRETKNIEPETGKSVYYYHKAVLLLSSIWVVLLIINDLFVIDNLYFNLIFFVMASFVYVLLFKTELKRLMDIVIVKFETQNI